MSKGDEKRRFAVEHATRRQVPLLVGLCGPSSSGKTYSALRLATGMQRVCGGKIVVADTESRRALHYASGFEFEHITFEAPFDPLSYLAAIEAAVDDGATIAIIDSASHEWEGPGGVLEMHDEKAQELARRWKTSVEKVNLTAWSEPKSLHRRMINSVLQLPIHTIWCVRAKEKIKPVPGKEPKQLGWMPIAADDLIYEMSVNMLLPPGSEGVPEWNPAGEGSKQIVKLPRQFKDLFNQRKPLDEETGEALARWAAGEGTPQRDDEAAQAARVWFERYLPSATSEEHVTRLEQRIPNAPASVQSELRAMCAGRRADLSGAAFEENPFEGKPEDAEEGTSQQGIISWSPRGFVRRRV